MSKQWYIHLVEVLRKTQTLILDGWLLLNLIPKRFGQKSENGGNPGKVLVDKRWRLPANYHGFSDKSGRSSIKLKRTNRYLQMCALKLDKAGRADDGTKFWTLADILLCRSNAFMAVVVHRTIKSWYWAMSREELFGIINDTRKVFCKKQFQGMKIYRYYILKRNGKWRPIGAPGLSTKLVHASLDMILRKKIEPMLPDFQHGFRPGRSCATATMEIIQALRKDVNQFVYEFDLKSFFNLVDATGLFFKWKPFTNEDWKGAMRWIHALLVGNFPIPLGPWRQENEVHLLGPTKDEDAPDRNLSGFPQGSPLSPLLSIATMAFVRGPNQLFGKLNNRGKFIMYADDGLIVSKKPDVNIDNIFDLEVRSKSSYWSNFHQPSDFGDDWYLGIELAKDKPYGKTAKFKFLGVNYDLRFPNNRIAYIDIPAGLYKEYPFGTQLKVNIDKASEAELQRFVNYARYSNTVNKHWNWEIKLDSYLWYNWAGLWSGLASVVVILLNWTGEYFPRAQKWVTWLVGWPVSSASSIAMTNLLEDLKFIPTYKMKSFRDLGSFTYFPKWPIIESGRQVFGRTVLMGVQAPEPMI